MEIAEEYQVCQGKYQINNQSAQQCSFANTCNLQFILQGQTQESYGDQQGIYKHVLRSIRVLVEGHVDADTEPSTCQHLIIGLQNMFIQREYFNGEKLDPAYLKQVIESRSIMQQAIKLLLETNAYPNHRSKFIYFLHWTHRFETVFDNTV